ncbi:winged helix-turn-helix transcriptional regulator [Streptomyces durbertensis]|uniref:Winged helix-turn-helix transcriptional regulator n=1 Tax=Streptomyces durbertensis TaxID=2448886 RepID=A0ABR6EH51_9ACTN|nr:winged helix-turn-helix domain-containing protein [Streptomyces durbertensis]MBB1244653.1 winged helix-turn-helix transcriptional regulator [Streptomyces durbertensis]
MSKHTPSPRSAATGLVGPDLASLAGLLADGTRAAMCLALLDGRAWTATELARHTGVAPSTATGHLHQLVSGGLLAEERQGRHRYVRLAGSDTAEMIESLASHAPLRDTPVRSLTDAHRRRALAHARTCYDHLAGTVAVAITEAMTERSLLTWDYGPALSEAGRVWLRDLGVEDHRPRGSRRAHVRTCLDWTERRPHLAGAVGAALCQHALDDGWVIRRGSSRVVTLTPHGRTLLHDQLGITEETLTSPDTDAF